MELENSQNNSLAKLPILKLGEYEMWEIRIKQYFQIQDYALWEVIENGYGNFMENGDTHVVVWLRELVFGMLYNDDKNLAFLTTSSPSSTNTINTANTGVSTGNTKVNTASTETSTASFSDATVYAVIVPRSKDNKNWNQGSSSKAVRIEDAYEKAMCAIDGGGFDWSDMAEDEIQANMALMAFTDSEVRRTVKKAREEYDALIIERLVSDDEEEVSLPKALTNRSNIQNINTGRQTVNTVRPNVNTVRARGFNAVKPSACWVGDLSNPLGAYTKSLTINYIDDEAGQVQNNGLGSPKVTDFISFCVADNSQLTEKGFVDCGCSWHMSG
ncbi:hypothetical protein Tco_0978698 [Tanacetum coccineum]|uniref:Uncharacterized protein n=1 Tax=Tanacetum coccineum TaxID=301880 RepID=A0ABQ5ENQ2_9ASTR